MFDFIQQLPLLQTDTGGSALLSVTNDNKTETADIEDNGFLSVLHDHLEEQEELSEEVEDTLTEQEEATDLLTDLSADLQTDKNTGEYDVTSFFFKLSVSVTVNTSFNSPPDLQNLTLPHNKQAPKEPKNFDAFAQPFKDEHLFKQAQPNFALGQEAMKSNRNDPKQRTKQNFELPQTKKQQIDPQKGQGSKSIQKTLSQQESKSEPDFISDTFSKSKNKDTLQLAKELNQQDLKVEKVQVEKVSSKPHFSPHLFHSGVQLAMQNLPEQMPPTLPNQAPLAGQATGQVENALQQAVNSGTTKLTLQLHPQELGTLNIVLTSVNGEVSATIRAEKQETAEMLFKQAETIRLNLEQQGIKVDKVEVQLNQSDEETANSDYNRWDDPEQHNSFQEENARREDLARMKNLATIRNLNKNSPDEPLEQSVHTLTHTERNAALSLDMVA